MFFSKKLFKFLKKKKKKKKKKTQKKKTKNTKKKKQVNDANTYPYPLTCFKMKIMEKNAQLHHKLVFS